MADYSPHDAENARFIVERLLSRQTEGLELEPNVVVSDVESDARAFSDQLELRKYRGFTDRIHLQRLKLQCEKTP